MNQSKHKMQQAKAAVSVQLHSEMAMRSEIIMQPQPDMSDPKPQFKQTKKQNKQPFA